MENNLSFVPVPFTNPVKLCDRKGSPGAKGTGGDPETLLREVLDSKVMHPEDWEALPHEAREEIARSPDGRALLQNLQDKGLVTAFQATRLTNGKTFGLVLGNYRVLDQLGSGGMGVVYKAEHVQMRRTVALKVLSERFGDDGKSLLRFYAEMRTVARLQHPNIVNAIDAGTVTGPGPYTQVLHYYVMEFVEGADLERHVREKGPMKIPVACDLVYQVASALGEAGKFNLVHRDIKPSNILLAISGQAKLLDFGLVRQFGQRLTQPGTFLGSIDYLAPEQARDCSNVDIRADIYALGGTPYWCLTGRTPFPTLSAILPELLARRTQGPPSLCEARPDAPKDLEKVVAKMMAVDPQNRYATPQAVMRALIHFKVPDSPKRAEGRPSLVPRRAESDQFGAKRVRPTILIVDDEPQITAFCTDILEAEGFRCECAAGAAEAMTKLVERKFNLILLDLVLPDTSGTDLLQWIREHPSLSGVKILLMSGYAAPDDLAALLRLGANDFLPKPLSPKQLIARATAALDVQQTAERAELLNRHLIGVNAALEKRLSDREDDLVRTRNALILAMSRSLERCDESRGHLDRVRRFCACIAEEAAHRKAFTGQIDLDFIQTIECVSPLHDLGKLGLPDYVILKPGKLTQEEQFVLQEHTCIGAKILKEAAKELSAGGFLDMGVAVCRHHHERFDGNGYPDGLRGTEIPLAARMVTLADAYDTLRSRKAYKPALAHGVATNLILRESAGQFDPDLLDVYDRCSRQFELIFEQVRDE